VSAARLGIFGGAFDPIHVGHLYVANAVCARAQLDRVLFLPVGEPAHRATHAPGADRRAMVALAIDDNPAFVLDETALQQPGPVYTADTLALLRQRYPDERFFFIAGTDALVHSKWRRLEEVLEALERFYVVAREQAAAAELQPLLSQLPRHLAERFLVLDLPLVDISASAIRDLVARGEPVRYLTPDSVARYIDEHSLYRNEKSAG